MMISQRKLWNQDNERRGLLFEHLLLFFFFFLVFLGPYPQHMEVPKLGVKSELEPLAYVIATAMPYPNLICDLHCSLQ